MQGKDKKPTVNDMYNKNISSKNNIYYNINKKMTVIYIAVHEELVAMGSHPM